MGPCIFLYYIMSAVVQLTFDNVASLASYNASSVPNLTIASVGIINDNYKLFTSASANIIAAADGVNIVLPAGPSGAAWIRLYERNIAAQYETAWFLDTTGSDANDGITSLTPLKTMEELSNRLRGAKISADVTVTLTSGDFSAYPVQLDLEIAQSVSILMVGNVTTEADTLAAVTNMVSGAASTNAGAVRGSITATTGSFTDRQRFTITSGAAINCIGYNTKVAVAGAGGEANVTRWGKLSNIRTSTLVTVATPSAADTYTLDTLNTTVGRLDIRVRGPGRFVITDCNIRGPGTTTVTHRGFCDNGNGNGVLTYGCIFSSPSSLVIQDGEWTAACCSLSADSGIIALSNTLFVSRQCVFTGTVATPSFEIRLQAGAIHQHNNSCCIDGGFVVIQNSAVWDQIGGTNYDVEFFDGTSTHAVEVAQTGTWWAHSSNNLQWGLDNTYTGVTYLIDGGGRYQYNAIPSVPGGTSDTTVGGTTDAYATLPVFISSGSGAGASMSDG